MSKRDPLAKLIKALPAGAREELDEVSGDPAALANAIVEAEEKIRDSMKEKDEDEKLAAAKEVAKDLSSAYGDVVKAQRAKIAYALYLKEGEATLVKKNKKAH